MVLHRRSFSDVSPEEVFLDKKNLPGFDSSRFEGNLERPIGGAIFIILSFIFLGIGLSLIGRVGYLTIVQGEVFAKTALENHLRHSVIVPERGAIYDRAMKPLAFNVPGFRVSVNLPKTYTYVPEDTLIIDLAQALEQDTSQLTMYLSKHAGQENLFVGLIRDWETASRLITVYKNDSRVIVTHTIIRSYIENPAYSHILGYIGRSSVEDIAFDKKALQWGLVGKTGLEHTYNTLLRGELGVKIEEIDSQNEVLSEGVFSKEIPGKSVVLSISSELQELIYEAVEDTVEERGFSGGSAVALDAKTGEVLALVSYPGYDINAMSSGGPEETVRSILSDTNQPLFNRAIAGLYPPASTIKPFLSAAALEEDLIAPDTNIRTNGQLVVPNPYDPDSPSIFHDWRDNGVVNMIKAIAFSSNIYFYIIGGGYSNMEGLGLSRIQEYLFRFGIGSVTNIDLAGEQEGKIPSEVWKRETYPEDPVWRVGDTYNTSIGQGGLLVTPIQMARAVLAVANGGSIIEPHLVSGIINLNGFREKVESKVVRSNIVSNETLSVVQQGMRAAVQEGTASGLSIFSMNIAAKTGTAQFEKKGRVHSWFIGFAPYEDPEIVLAISLENGAEHNLIGGVYVASQIFQWYSHGGREVIHGTSLDL